MVFKMFTGIIEALGVVKALAKEGHNCKLTIESLIFADQRVGQSIAVNGVCLTISILRNNLASFDIMYETIRNTNLGNFRVGDRVNLERALKIGDRLSGHFVTGHVDRVGKIIKMTSDGSNLLRVGIQKEDMRFIVPKGSVALDGISLTISDLGIDNFSVHLIPNTINNTNLKFKKVGSSINVEFDILGKYAARRPERGITEDFLRAHGFS